MKTNVVIGEPDTHLVVVAVSSTLEDVVRGNNSEIGAFIRSFQGNE